MADQHTTPSSSRSALTRESNRSSHSRVVGGRWSRQVRRASHSRRSRRRTPPQQTNCAQPGVILELRRSSRLVPRSDYAISERWSYGADVTYETRYDTDSHKSGDRRFPSNHKRSSSSLLHERKKQKTVSLSSNSTTEDCVAYSTRSRTALKTSESSCELNSNNYPLSTAPSTSNAQSSIQGESGLLPLDERDYVYSPFSTSTVADLIDSDHSVYSPSTHKGKGKKRKRSSLSNKRSHTSLEDCRKKLKLAENNRQLASESAQQSCNYPLRNRNNRDLGASTSSLDHSEKPTTSNYVATSDNYNITHSRERGGTPPLPRDLQETSTPKSVQTAESQLLIVPRDLPYLRQTNARRSIAAATGATLGGCLTRASSSAGRQRQEGCKRVVTTAEEEWGRRRRDMPQPPTPTTRRDKRGKSTLGSCVSTSGSSSRSHPQTLTTGAVPSTSATPPASTSLSSMPDNGNETKAKSKSNTAGSSEGAMGGSSSSSEEGEVGRLQALLEARGLPPHLLGALGPRMQHLLHRTVTANSAASKAAQLLAGLQATGDEGQQLQAVIEMCQLLVMGNEDTLAGFPVRQVVPALINLLAAEHNFDMMNHACRALTYMLEALPRSSGAVALAVPAFLDKLQAITCMDVAEQSLTALDMLSRRHAKAILQARGVSACLMYLDFFSINAQRAALSITANCCQNLTADEFHLVRDSLQLLANRLTQQDKKSVECVCLAFSRLVDSFQTDPARLQEIATPELLTNLQQLLVVQPALISGTVFITVLRLLWMMCSACPQLALQLHQRSITDTLLCLLTGSSVQQEHVELLSRSPQELYEITCLIAELLPRLPSDGIFSVDAYLDKPWASTAPDRATAHWQWRDDRGVWRSYSVGESVALEAGAAAGEAEVCLMALGRAYTVDLTAMHQLNEHTGTARPVQRLPVASPPVPPPASDPRVALLSAPSLLPSLLGVLLQLYWSSAGPALKAAALKAILRAVFHADATQLSASLNLQLISSHLAGMMAATDARIVVGSLQLAEILMQRLPDEMAQQFRREGVLHQVAQLAINPLKPTPNKNNSPTAANSSKQPDAPSTPASTSSSSLEPNKLSLAFSASGSYVVSSMPTIETNIPESSITSSTSSQLHASTSVHRSSSPMQLAEMLKRKRAVKRSGGSQTAQRLGRRRDEPAPLAHAASHGSSSSVPSVYRNAKGTSSKTSSFLSSLNPTRWGRSPHSHKDSPLAKHQANTNLAVQNKEKVREWVQWFARRVEREWACAELGLEALERLRSSAEALSPLLTHEQMHKPLEQIRDALNYQDVSPFELNHSGVLNALLTFLTGRSAESLEDQTDKDDVTEDSSAYEERLRMFLHVFADLPLSADAEWPMGGFPVVNSSFSALVSKVNGCVSHLEQFPVRVHDLPARPSSSALKFFNTHQLMCDLKRHPNCNNLKQWKGGVVRIDPLALVQAIERYLSQRGYATTRPRDGSSTTNHSDDEGASDDDVDDALATPTQTHNDAEHKLEFLIGDVVLPYNMTVYQAVRQFSELNDADTDSETPLANAGIWVQTHTIYYRSVEASDVKSTEAGPSRKGKGQPTKVSSRRKPDLLWNEGIVPVRTSPLSEAVRWPKEERDVTDASLPALRLLRALYALARHWPSLYRVPCMPDHRPLLPYADFINQKLAAKASRQLQDPLVIMTGNLPPWLKKIAYACPFVFPFECRHLLFYVVSFDRDRALQRLLESGGGAPSSANESERVAPRLDRRKRTVQRDNVLRQAESVMHEFGHSKALLEIQYENEVGTGLGPTLEFYALVSHELQRADLDLWHGSENFKLRPSSFGHEIVKGAAAAQDRLASSVRDALSLEERTEGAALVQWPCGLFPQAVGRNARAPLVSRLKAKFRFLGKLMAKAVMDSRMLDVPLSLTMYRWALGEAQWLSLADVRHVAPELWRSLCRLRPVADNADRIANDDRLSPEQRTTMINALELDGCPIEELGLDFILPGDGCTELRRGGRDIPVTAHNLNNYINLVTHWLLYEGVNRQMEAFREGFESVFPLANLKIFYPEELEQVFCGSPSGGFDARWDPRLLSECIRPDHGYTAESRAIRMLIDILASYCREEQRLFLQFVTGSPRLPTGGFKALNPPLTVVRKSLENVLDPDEYLPSVMTCVNYLKLPDYSSAEVMRAKLRLAANEGQHSFHLS